MAILEGKETNNEIKLKKGNSLPEEVISNLN
jgi:hypothetical protein